MDATKLVKNDNNSLFNIFACFLFFIQIQCFGTRLKHKKMALDRFIHVGTYVDNCSGTGSGQEIKK
jgi:hypothetical protein